jgi:sulfite reductase alpha subunit-like flavoprotein
MYILCTSTLTREDKVFGFLEVVVKSGRSETNSGSGEASIDYRPWEEVHRSLSQAMKERMEPYEVFTKEPHEIRGTFKECRYRGHISGRASIDKDPTRRTSKVTIDIYNSGVTVSPGDRIAIMPRNNGDEVDKIVRALDLNSILDGPVPATEDWQEYLQHMIMLYGTERPAYLTAREIFLGGVLSPLSRNVLEKADP